MSFQKIALIGNPNVGKSSLFNQLTGLKQKIGNYPGTTVEKRVGKFVEENHNFTLYDFPGTYSLYPKSKDEEVVFDILSNPEHPDFPDKVLVIGTPNHLKRNLLLWNQVKDLEIPVLFVLNRMDELETEGISLDKSKLEEFIGNTVFYTNARTGEGISLLKKRLLKPIESQISSFEIPLNFKTPIAQIKQAFRVDNDYLAWQYLAQNEIPHLSKEEQNRINEIRTEFKIIPARLQVKETLQRNEVLENVIEEVATRKDESSPSFTERLDKVLMHPFWGYFIFFGILFLTFQAIYSWSEWPMNLIDSTFAGLRNSFKNTLGDGPLIDLITDGVIPGIGGVVIFVPQILILFFFLILMEESGYMSRVVFLMDKWLRPFGLNGKSVVPLMSGAACAIPAIMSARNIENTKDRLITILVTPFITCSARLPVYAILIALVIPKGKFLGFQIQGWVLMGLYLMGLLAALTFGLIFKRLIQSKYKSYLIMELPSYRFPVWKNVLLGMWEKTMAFVLGAGKIILAVSIILWALSAWGVSDEYKNANDTISELAQKENWTSAQQQNHLESYKLEHSLLGNLGKTVEPIFRPLGYDWKISLGVLSSFAAREVFVGTMASIYSIGGDAAEDEQLIVQKMAKEKRPDGHLVFNFATGISLMLFYAFAMQCMSTLAVVKRETGGWKWPMIQLFFMSSFAYLTALIAYQILR